LQSVSERKKERERERERGGRERESEREKRKERNLAKMINQYIWCIFSWKLVAVKCDTCAIEY
jgi:hypothetical protein